MPGCAVGSRSQVRRPVSHTSAGRCHSCQRSRLGAARLSGPARRCVWNQCTSAALIMHSAAHAQLASQAVKGFAEFTRRLFEKELEALAPQGDVESICGIVEGTPFDLAKRSTISRPASARSRDGHSIIGTAVAADLAERSG